MTAEEFKSIAPQIPSQPGIYKYFNAGGIVIYVGKAKDLKKRVGSYFNKTGLNLKTLELVRQIRKIEYTVTESEQDALFLENALIKQLQPKFNIDLKDDKTYPFIVIKKEAYPRVFLTRRKISDGSEYLGPFTSVGRVRELLQFIRETIPLRNCKLNLSSANIQKGKFKVCLEYHLGNCKGPCEGLQTEEDYAEQLKQVKNLLRGNLSPVIKHFSIEMKQQAEGLQFEKAEAIRHKIEYLKQYQAKSTIVNPSMGTIDVFSIVRREDEAFVCFLMVENGTIIQTKNTLLRTKLEETDEEVLSFAIGLLRNNLGSTANEIIVPFKVPYPEAIKQIIPAGGDKLKLLQLATHNAQVFSKQAALKLKTEPTDAEQRALLEQLQKSLHLSQLPLHIECFDNSHFQGSYPVSAMVCFKNGIPSKKDYRHFNVKTVTGINDFATMKEAVYRRYSRLLAENSELPQLVIIDGGKGQLNAALEAIHDLGLTGKLTLVGLAKREEEIFFGGDQQSLKLSWDSPSLLLVRKIRDEVHRFGISFHRDKRSRGTFSTELERIDGIGPKTIDLLMQTFKSVKKIQEQTTQQLAAVIGESKAKVVWNHFHAVNKPE